VNDHVKPVTARRRETQERLMDAAFGVCVELGLGGASVEVMCAAAGFTRGAFYSNFSSKEELFFALLAREYRRRTATVEARVALLGEQLESRETAIGRAEAAEIIGEFFEADELDADWYLIEQEFLLLALRDPSLAPEYLGYQAEFAADLSVVVVQIVAVAGRHFVIPAAEASALLASLYDRALRMAMLAGGGAGVGAGAGAGAGAGSVVGSSAELGERVADLLFALTAEGAAGGEAGLGD
jgi:AcrR family transcriptional regulator